MEFNYRTEYNRYRRYFTSLEPMVKTPVALAYFSLIASLFALSFFGAFAIRPTVKTIVGLRKEISDARITNNKLQEKINSLSEAQTQYSLVQNDVPVVLAALPKNPEFSILLKQIENIVVASGATVSGIQFQSVPMFGKVARDGQTVRTATSSASTTNPSPTLDQPGNSEMITPVSFSLVLRGSYSNITAFLTSLSQLSRLISVDSFAISSAQGGNVELSLNIQSKAFYYE